MANSSIAAMTEDLEAMRRDHDSERKALINELEEAQKSHLSMSAKLLDLRRAYGSQRKRMNKTGYEEEKLEFYVNMCFSDER